MLFSGSGAAIGRHQVTFGIYGYETIGCFVEYGEPVSCSSKCEGFPMELVQHFYCRYVVISFEGGQIIYIAYFQAYGQIIMVC